MRKISREEVLAEIWKARGDQIVSWMASKGEPSLPYSFDNFTRDMLKSELIADKRTIQTKWDLLCASDVVRPRGKPHTYGDLSFMAFKSRMTASAEDMLDSIVNGERQTDTHTYTHASAGRDGQ